MGTMQTLWHDTLTGMATFEVEALVMGAVALVMCMLTSILMGVAYAQSLTDQSEADISL